MAGIKTIDELDAIDAAAAGDSLALFDASTSRTKKASLTKIYDFLGGYFSLLGHVHSQSEVTNLVADLALKAPLASPTLTGTPAAPTAAADTSTTQIATTAFVVGQGYAKLASPALTGTPTAPTAAAGTSTTQIATTAFVGTEIANLVASSPAALDTLNELAAALGNDANFATTVTNALALKAPLVSPSFTTPALGTPTSGNLANCTNLPSSGISDASSIATASVVMKRDSSANVFVNQSIQNMTTTTTAAGTTTLTLGSSYVQRFVGSSAQSVVLPDATTLPSTLNWGTMIVNDSTGSVTLKTSDGTTLVVVTTGTQAVVRCTSVATSVGTWSGSGDIGLIPTSGASLAYTTRTGSGAPAVGGSSGSFTAGSGVGGTYSTAGSDNVAGNSGSVTFTSLAGGACSAGTSSNLGGNSGNGTWKTSSGGAATGTSAATATGGNSGTANYGSGAGGAATSSAGDATGGTPGATTLQAGSGGAATCTGGGVATAANGAVLNITGSSGGNASGAGGQAGSAGQVVIRAGTAGVGSNGASSGNHGSILIASQDSVGSLYIDNTGLYMSTSVSPTGIIKLDSRAAIQIGTSDSKLCFFGSAAIVQRTGAAQVAVDTTPATNVTPYGFSQSQADGIITLLNELRASLVAYNLIKGAA